MVKIVQLLRLILLILSFYGYIQYFRKKIEINLTIGFIFSSIGSLMFLAGILNILREMALVIFIGGLLLAAVSVLHKESIRNVLSSGTIFFFIAGIFFFFLLYGSKFLHYDNFSHWAVAPKIMIQNDRFPNFRDRNYMFTSYPLGSASFIYYMSWISGIASEWFQMYAQALLMVGLLAGLFSFSKQIIPICLAGFCGVVLLCGNTNFVDLLVDTLLPLVGLGGVLVCLFYREYIDEKIAYLIPYTVFLVAVKNSGVFFVLIIVCLALYYLKNKKHFKSWLLLVLPPIICLLLWQRHADYVFVAGMSSKHAMSLANYSAVFNGKTAKEIVEIVKQILKQTLSLTNAGMQLLIVAVIIWLLWRVVLKGKNVMIQELALLTVLSYFAYQIGIIGMYIFSMPLIEASQLAGYTRYHCTILIFISGLVSVEALLCFQGKDGSRFIKSCRIGCMVSLALVLVLVTSPNFSYLQKQNLEGTERKHFDMLIQENHVSPDMRYAILTGEARNDGEYLSFMTKYLLNPVSFTLVSDSNIANITWENYDYVILFGETPETRETLAMYYTGSIIE